MLIFKKNKIILQNKKIIFKIFIIFLVTSCNLDILQKENNLLLNKNNPNQLKKLIIPKGITIPREDEEYKIPYTKEDLKKEKSDIFPPV